MEPKEVQKLREAVVKSIHDGRSIDSLRSALKDSGYSKEDIQEVTSGIDPSKIGRRPPKKNIPWGSIASVCLIAAVVLLGYILLFQPAENPSGDATVTNTTPSGDGVPETATKICYASNESIKDAMIQAGALCDKWFIVKEVKG